jgi:hypothetical protein
VSVVIEPTLNLTGCLFSLCVLYPCCLLGDADAIEISLERVGDRNFFTYRRKFMFTERVVYDLKGVTRVRLTDCFDPDGPNIGVQVSVVVDHEAGCTTLQLPHPYRKSFYTHFVEFQVIATEIIDGTHNLESASPPVSRRGSQIDTNTSTNTNINVLDNNNTTPNNNITNSSNNNTNNRSSTNHKMRKLRLLWNTDIESCNYRHKARKCRCITSLIIF